MCGLRGHLGVIQVAALPLLADILEELLVLLGLLTVYVTLLLAQHTACTGHQVGHIGVVAYTDVASVGGDIGHPVAVDGIGAVVLVSAACLGSQEAHITLVGIQVLTQNVLVACHHIYVPGNDNTGLGPSGRTIFHTPVIGSDNRVGTV